MKPFDKRTNSRCDEQCAGELLDTVPLIMHVLRSEMRIRRPADLSVPQFRVLAFLRRREGTSLSDVADHLGLTLSTMSKMVDALVLRNYVIREVCPDDRRRMVLGLTSLGRSVFDKAACHARARIAHTLSGLSGEDRQTIIAAMKSLQQVFLPKPNTASGRSVYMSIKQPKTGSPG